ncbi:hypothetical protein FA15DRAFT_698064 [Coprinopsis marcescibilis]|uniref:F-box domain-containing protein n=1 Tax=Coprinopsis marcescibilis TaxID=230819 RepID=A0A5C3KE35_COPMA|nr:hypothetical protein FA15DRAFT_698064 [Coprinopsis marcescibilis]
MPISKFPTELIQHALGYLKDDKVSLSEASLVCTAFLGPCQKILFSTIKFAQSSYETTAKRYSPGKEFLTILQASPHLATYVRRVEISDRRSLPLKSSGWLRSDQAFPAVLNIMSANRITSLQISRVNWTSQPKDTQTAILTLLSSSFLESLAFFECNLPFEIFSHGGPSFRRLSAFSTQDTLVSCSKNAGRPKVRLESFDLTFPSSTALINFTLNSSNIIDVKGLKRLSARIIRRGAHIGDLEPLLKVCGSSLETFAWAYRYDATSHTDHGPTPLAHWFPNLSGLTSLKFMETSQLANNFDYTESCITAIALDSHA